MRRGWGVALLAFGASIAGCSDRFPDYRYRMTIEVDTPQGLRSGSSVVEVETRGVDTIQGSSGKSFRTRVHGEAVAVDIAPGQTLFALLSKPLDADYARTVAPAALLPVRDTRPDIEGYRQYLEQLARVKGRRELPRDKWPLLVSFADSADASSIMEVDADALHRVFGPGVTIRRITVEITDDDVTYGIRDRFPWWSKYLNRHFDGTSTVAEDVNDPSLAAHLSSGSFSTRIE